MTLFQTGDFTLASGVRSTWKIECDALTAEDWRGLAAMLVEVLPDSFGRVEGVPRGGLPLAAALDLYRDTRSSRLLVVDDVWTTGGSMHRFIAGLEGDPYVDMRAVVFARNPAPSYVTALFTMASKP